MAFQNTLAIAKDLDAKMNNFRSYFLIPKHKGEEAIYFLGNSLGLQPKKSEAAIKEVLDQWHALGVESFFKGEKPWLDLHQSLLPVLAEIVGALPHEVVVMNSLTVNLHLMMVSFYQPSGKRTKILCEAKAFPSDQYMLHSHVAQRGFNPDDTIVEVHPRPGEVLVREEDILIAVERHKDELALVFWGGVNYYTGQVFNMEAIAKVAHNVGAKVGFDLAHAVGNIPLQLHDWGADFACWCSYKYLNSGPGAVGGAFVHQRHHADTSLNRLAGWWGNKRDTQFLMEKTFVPETTAEGWGLSTPPIILYAAHKAALEVFEEANVQAVFAQNKKLTEYLWNVVNETVQDVPEGSLKVLTPATARERGCQVSLVVKNGKKVFDFLAAEGLFADWREPDVIRVAPVSLYNTHAEVWRFGQLLKQALLTFAA